MLGHGIPSLGGVCWQRKLNPLETIDEPGPPSLSHRPWIRLPGALGGGNSRGRGKGVSVRETPPALSSSTREQLIPTTPKEPRARDGACDKAMDSTTLLYCFGFHSQSILPVLSLMPGFLQRSPSPHVPLLHYA